MEATIKLDRLVVSSVALAKHQNYKNTIMPAMFDNILILVTYFAEILGLILVYVLVYYYSKSIG